MGLYSYFQNLRNDGNELCSQFSKYVSPAYHHDKCERCVQMRLYSMNKAEITFAYAIFVVLLLLAIIIGLSGPPIEYTYVHNVSNTTTGESADLEKGGPFVFVTPALTRYNKQFWLFMVLHNENVDDETYSENMLTSTSIAGLGISKGTGKRENEAGRQLVLENEMCKNRTRYVWCKKRTCDPILVAHLSFIRFTRYRFEVRFHNFEHFHRKYNVQRVTFILRSYSSDFMQMEMSFRIMYAVTTMFATLWFGNSLRKYAVSDWSYEQKWLMVLLILLLFYNGPTYSMTTIVNHWLIGFIDSMSQITFITALVLFNLCIYHAFRQNERRFLSFYLEKMVIVSVLWSLATSAAYYQRVREYSDYSFNFKLDSGVYQMIVKWWLAFAAVYIAFLLLSMLKAYTDLRTMPFFDKRLKFATTNVMVLAMIICGTWSFNYGIIGIIEDMWVANATESQLHSTSATFMALYASLNFYTYLIVYIYSPTQKSIFENVVMKDNPAFSMINDSEDEDTPGTTSLFTKTRTPVINKSSLFTSDDEADKNIILPFACTDDSD